MWQLYGLMALDLLKQRRREAEAERQAYRAGKPNPRREDERRFATLRQAIWNTHRA